MLHQVLRVAGGCRCTGDGGCSAKIGDPTGQEAQPRVEASGLQAEESDRPPKQSELSCDLPIADAAVPTGGGATPVLTGLTTSPSFRWVQSTAAAAADWRRGRAARGFHHWPLRGGLAVRGAS